MEHSQSLNVIDNELNGSVGTLTMEFISINSLLSMMDFIN